MYTNLIKIFQNTNKYCDRNSFSNTNFGIKGNLAPLKNDTISFSGKRREIKEEVDKRSDKAQGKHTDKSLYSILGPTVRKVLQEAEPVYGYYEGKLKNVFKDCVTYEGNNPKGSVGYLETNLKGYDSTLGKFVRKGIRSVDEAKETCNDIIRARIVLNTGSKYEANKIFKALARAIENEELEIIDIKNYRNNSETSYLSPRNEYDLLDIVPQKNETIEIVPRVKDSGYHACHVLFKLKNGFKGELQIMGKNIKNAKSVEDVIYQVETNSPIFDEKSKEIRRQYNQLTKSQKEKLHNYIKDIYISQRNKEIKRVVNSEFLEAPEGIPEFFDFNILSKFLRE